MGIKADSTATLSALANPVAYRILAAVGTHGTQTTAELAAVVDVPTSSLYRHLSRLRRAGILRVTAERQARGAVERTYALASREAGAMSMAAVAAAPASQLRAALRNFLAAMFAETSAYLGSKAFARRRPRMGASLAICELNDQEYDVVHRELVATLNRLSERSAGNRGAKKRYVYIVSLPELAAAP